MGINVTVRKYPKQKDVITAEAALEREIRSCMRCKFFHNSRQCIANECVETAENRKLADGITEKQCIGCPYSQLENYCFPCMKKLLRGTEEKIT